MPEKISPPAIVEAAGTKPKRIEEFVGRVRTDEPRLSLARMRSPAGWKEPGQRPDFDEWTLVLSGELQVEFEGGSLSVGPGEAVHARPGEWVRYSTDRDTEYVAVCLPAFSPGTVHRDADA